MLQVEVNDVVKKQFPLSEPGGLEETDFAGISKNKEINDEKNINNRDETIPIKASALKYYSSADDNNTKNKETGKYNVNFGYDAAGDETCVTSDQICALAQQRENAANGSTNGKKMEGS